MEVPKKESDALFFFAMKFLLSNFVKYCVTWQSTNTIEYQKYTHALVERWFLVFRKISSQEGEAIINFVAGLYVQKHINALRVANSVRKAPYG